MLMNLGRRKHQQRFFYLLMKMNVFLEMPLLLLLTFYILPYNHVFTI